MTAGLWPSVSFARQPTSHSCSASAHLISKNCGPRLMTSHGSIENQEEEPFSSLSLSLSLPSKTIHFAMQRTLSKGRRLGGLVLSSIERHRERIQANESNTKNINQDQRMGGVAFYDFLSIPIPNSPLLTLLMIFIDDSPIAARELLSESYQPRRSSLWCCKDSL